MSGSDTGKCERYEKNNLGAHFSCVDARRSHGLRDGGSRRGRPNANDGGGNAEAYAYTEAHGHAKACGYSKAHAGAGTYVGTHTRAYAGAYGLDSTVWLKVPLPILLQQHEKPQSGAAFLRSGLGIFGLRQMLLIEIRKPCPIPPQRRNRS